MQSFQERLGAVKSNLERLDALVLACPELFDYAYGVGIEPERAWVYIHARNAPKNFNWWAFARKYHAGWQRERNAEGMGFDWRGTLGGVELVIIGAEPAVEPQPLFAEQP